MSAWADVVVLFGGSSTERRVSVASAQHLALAMGKVELWFWAPDGALSACPRDVLLAHERPFERDFTLDGEPSWGSLEEALDAPGSRQKAFLLALHGGAGEDGRVQALFERRGLAFTGSGSAASGRAWDKLVAKEHAHRRSIKTSPSVLLLSEDPGLVRRRLETFLVAHGRAVVKPVADGSSIGLMHVRGVRDLGRAMAELLDGPRVPRMAEAFVDGRELTVGVVDGPEGPRALPVSEVNVVAGGAFDYAGKYLGRGATEVTPARVPAYVAHAAQTVALTMHKALGCEGYSRTDVISTGRGVIFLELNTLPGLTRASFVPQQLAAAGVTLESFLDGQLTRARARRDASGRRAA